MSDSWKPSQLATLMNMAWYSWKSADKRTPSPISGSAVVRHEELEQYVRALTTFAAGSGSIDCLRWWYTYEEHAVLREVDL